MRTSRFVLMLVLLLPLGNSAAASELLRWEGTPGSVEHELPPSIVGIVHQWPVEVNLREIVANAEARRSVEVDFPGEGDLTFNMINFENKSGFIAVGEGDDFDVIPDPDVADEELSYFWYGAAEHFQMTISVRRGRIAATIQADGRVYSISALEPQPVLREFDLSRIPKPFDLEEEERSEPPKLAHWAMPMNKNIVDTVDVLFVHTADALTEASSQALLNDAVTAAEDQLNEALHNSGVSSVRVRNVMSGPNYSEFVNYNENSGHTCTNPNVEGCRWVGHRIWLRTDSTVDSLRSAYGADLVVMLVGDGVTIAGVAYTQRFDCGVFTGFENTSGCDVGAPFGDFAYAVVNVTFAISSFTFAHEVGHNFGMEHASNSGTTSYAWSFAKVLTGVTQTVMGTSNLSRSLQFSNPNVPFIGLTNPSGETLRFNARTAYCLAPVMSGFRSPGQIIRVFWDSFEDPLIPIPVAGC